MNGSRKFKSLRLVRFGDILYDQQRRLILLCRSCQHHFLSLEAFQSHLTKCIGVKHIVSSINELDYDEDKRETRLVNGQQELFIYEPQAIRKNDCKIDWEAELEDPRWYSDDSVKSPPSKAKQSPANTKENVSKVRTRFQASNEAHRDKDAKRPQQQPPELSPTLAKRGRHSTPRRTILTNQQQGKPRSSLDLPAASSQRNDSEGLIPDNIATKNTPAPLPMVTVPVSNVSNHGDTQQILNKLRACGVEVKRRKTHETIESPGDAVANAKKQQALDIMRKLQSNGIKCTKVSKQTIFK
ncbi:uncharacterized protein LOC132792626 [Drosophila nasuta]|uniref:uncharacterized protein LOC132792626 n=1 Tax=Drosophila nasuta TaxID=42062 RepID=UPI00295E47B6|nr:uncharacterized protein LOC132792626 [Drosophila nasuta]XP_060658044.1 uncharacterized protein LOC132792626 [Drosophila nasuta]